MVWPAKACNTNRSTSPAATLSSIVAEVAPGSNTMRLACSGGGTPADGAWTVGSGRVSGAGVDVAASEGAAVASASELVPSSVLWAQVRTISNCCCSGVSSHSEMGRSGSHSASADASQEASSRHNWLSLRNPTTVPVGPSAAYCMSGDQPRDPSLRVTSCETIPWFSKSLPSPVALMAQPMPEVPVTKSWKETSLVKLNSTPSTDDIS